MKNFFKGIIERHLGLSDIVLPRSQSRFESSFDSQSNIPEINLKGKYIYSQDVSPNRDTDNSIPVNKKDSPIKSNLKKSSNISNNKPIGESFRRTEKIGKSKENIISEEYV